MRRLRVMVVDDNTAVGEALAEAGRLRGHEAMAVCSVDEALKVARKFAPTAFIVDWKLPTDPGDTFIRALRSGDDPPPVVSITAADEEPPCLPEGVPSIHKPTDPDEIYARLEAEAERLSVERVPKGGAT